MPIISKKNSFYLITMFDCENKDPEKNLKSLLDEVSKRNRQIFFKEEDNKRTEDLRTLISNKGKAKYLIKRSYTAFKGSYEKKIGRFTILMFSTSLEDLAKEKNHHYNNNIEESIEELAKGICFSNFL